MHLKFTAGRRLLHSYPALAACPLTDSKACRGDMGVRWDAEHLRCVVGYAAGPALGGAHTFKLCK